MGNAPGFVEIPDADFYNSTPLEATRSEAKLAFSRGEFRDLGHYPKE
jgi:hypothetical protein